MCALRKQSPASFSHSNTHSQRDHPGATSIFCRRYSQESHYMACLSQGHLLKDWSLHQIANVVIIYWDKTLGRYLHTRRAGWAGAPASDGLRSHAISSYNEDFGDVNNFDSNLRHQFGISGLSETQITPAEPRGAVLCCCFQFFRRMLQCYSAVKLQKNLWWTMKLLFTLQLAGRREDNDGLFTSRWTCPLTKVLVYYDLGFIFQQLKC